MSQSVTIRVGQSLKEAEKAFFIATYQAMNGDKIATAHVLGICLKSVYNKLREYSPGDPPRGAESGLHVSGRQ